MIADLPNEILYEIFCFLSPGDLIRCCETCTQWNGVASQPRLWKCINLSHLSPSELRRLAWQTLWMDDPSRTPPLSQQALAQRIASAEAINVICPSYIGPKDLRSLQLLLLHNDCLRELRLERIQVSCSWATKLFDALPSTLVHLSLRQTLADAATVERILRLHAPQLVTLDLSYTSIEDSTLDCIASCLQLRFLYLDGVFKLTSGAIQQFLQESAPVGLAVLSLRSFYCLRPLWVFEYIKRQIRAGGPVAQSIDLHGCDLFTCKDIIGLCQMTRNNCKISHSAILAEDSLQGYRDLIDRICQGVVELRA
ncbi:hypothetical protein TRVA0_002S01904 [Trichomonascus vanleenenianus]|uniref:F-box protein n=1 Tax=Trichomonascus vanleenenianus TaxID=2268995 RepID=UPI003ECB674C